MPYTSAVIVLYNPVIDELAKNIYAIIPQVNSIILIDNSVRHLNLEFLKEIRELKKLKIEYIFNNQNLGVAAAQNIGLKMAISRGAEYLIIFDQDSCPSDNMVRQLFEDYQLLLENGVSVGAIGPMAINIQTNKPYNPRIRRFRPFPQVQHVLQVTELISSGCLLHKDVLTIVGLMDEKLFIDGVDHEWCWRAKTFNYHCALTTKARLYHMLGEGDRKFLGINVAITSPFRVYFQYRNFFYLLKKGYVPLYWKLNNALKYVIKLLYYPVFIHPQKVYFKNIIKGIIDGVKKR
ncbi:glycosyltransferase family 2 protein [Pedobacter sp. P351]|uniref:glycosyltransferase family 2 protein n=1 Tax=Pedobacter superstes TaxID=3133441 RepID=UPI0030AD8A26